jgi:hypothetical protein
MRGRFGRTQQAAVALAGCALVLGLLSGCGGGGGGAPTATTGVQPGAGSQDSTGLAGMGEHMAGAQEDVHVSASAIAAQPANSKYDTPEDAIRSYLDWTSYVYRIGQSDAATPAMSASEYIRVDAYNQYNLQEKRLIDQQLTSIVFGKPSVSTSSTVVPAHEVWSYKYLAITQGNPVSGGPYTATYDTTYTVIKKNGKWLVDSVTAKAKGTVK